MKKIQEPWAIELNNLERSLNSDFKKGLNEADCTKKLSLLGKNKITQSKTITFWDIFLEEIREPLILMLLLVGIIYSVWGNIGDAITIFSVIIIVTFVEVYTEFRAKKNIESLPNLSSPTTWVIRNGISKEVNTEDIVPGDILILMSGERIPADARVISSLGLEIDEAQLTGESLPVSKVSNIISENTELPERINMVHMGSTVVKGKGNAIVTSIGMNTELGKIAGLVQTTREPKTPLQKSMKQLSMSLVWIAIFFSIIIPILGMLRGLPFKDMVLTGFSLAFATIPEEMPIIITMVLGLGAYNLSKKNVLIRRTKAVETLGSVTVIATDKTGTLTENKMKIKSILAEDKAKFLSMCALMADIVENEDSSIGDPMDIILVNEAKKHNIYREELLKEYTLIKDYGFDNDKKIFKFKFKNGNKYYTLIKGAPENIVEMSTASPLTAKLNELMNTGDRIIGYVYNESLSEETTSFTFLGFVRFEDPIREDVKDAVKVCNQAGIKVMMITGDHKNTAKKVAEQVGMDAQNVLVGTDLIGKTPEELKEMVKSNSIFARITPEQKLSIVKALRDNGEVIAVTGDGINDAPALKSADIGISMGKNGTDVAKEASDMILTDDSFVSVVSGISEGRKLFANLSKCVRYYLSCKVALLISFLIPLILNIPLPFAPIQIILLELFMDLASTTSFVSEPMEMDVLKQKPRNANEKFMNRSSILQIFSHAVTLSLCVLIVYLYSWFSTQNISFSQTMAFVTWLLGHVILALNMRTNRIPILKVGLFSNRYFIIWMIGVVFFLISSINIDFLRIYLKLTSISISNILLIIIVIAVMMVWMELKKLIRYHISTNNLKNIN